MDDRERLALGLRRQVVTEDLPEHGVHDGVEPFLREAVPVLFRLPDVEVPQPTLRSFDGHVGDQALRRFGAELVRDAPVERGVDGNVLHEGIGHGASSLSSEVYSDE